MTTLSLATTSAATTSAALAVEAGAAPRSIAVTGASGFLGGYVLRALLDDARGAAPPAAAPPPRVLALDLRPPAAALGPAHASARLAFAEADIRDPALAARLRAAEVDCVIHLAFCVSPDAPRERARAIDVDGTRNVVESALAAGVRHLIVVSSGAAYGYRADNAAWLDEAHPLRADEAFPYAHHKRLVEEMLAAYRASHPALRQLILRPGAILGPGTRTAVTEPFEKRVVLGLRGVAAPFNFVWVEDVAAIVALGARERREGIFNVSGDGVVTLREVAARLGKPYLALPGDLLGRLLGGLRRLGLSSYGPEHVDFLRYRPVPSNDALKQSFGYTPRLTAEEAFARYCEARGAR